MNCFLFIFMITLTVATSNPVDDLSYGEIVDLVNNCDYLKEQNVNIHIRGKYNVNHEKYNRLEGTNLKLQKIKDKLKQKLKDTKSKKVFLFNKHVYMCSIL